MTQAECEKAIREGVRRGRAVVVSVDFTHQGDVKFLVAEGEGGVAQIGYEYAYSNWTPEQIKERVRRFTEHYVWHKPYHWHWGESI